MINWKRRNKMWLKLTLLITVGFWLLLFVFYGHNNYNNSSSRLLGPRLLQLQKRFQRTKITTNTIDCNLLFEWNESELRKAKKNLSKALAQQLPDENFIFDKTLCASFRELRGYHSANNSASGDSFERSFSLAYSILTYNNVEQFERLLRLIYRPQNVYCVHIDAKSSLKFQAAVRSIVQCFDNVFVCSKLERVVYAGISRLQADLNCMSDLLKSAKKWKYLLNLASSEFPLRTNYELTRILALFNGANDIEIMQHSLPVDRVMYSWREEADQLVKKTSLNKTSPVPPHNFTLVKGITYGAFSRAFVEFVLTSKHAKDLLEWARDTYSPDEWYWATIQYNTQFKVPGGFRDEKRQLVPTRTRFIGWKHSPSFRCMGQYRHNICVFGVEDLAELVSPRRQELFANKMLLESDPVAYACMEEWLERRIVARPPLLRVDAVGYCRLPHVQAYTRANDTTCARLLAKTNNKKYKK